MRLYAKGQFVNGVTERSVAALFGISMETVKRDVSEASRALRRNIARDEELQELIMVQLQQNAADLEAIASNEFLDAAVKVRAIDSKTKALSILAGVSGAAAPKKIEAKHAIDQSDESTVAARLRQALGIEKHGDG